MTTDKSNSKKSTQSQAESESDAATSVSPLIILASVAVMAGLAYLVWTKKDKIQEFVKDHDLGEKLKGALGGVQSQVKEMFNSEKVAGSEKTN